VLDAGLLELRDGLLGGRVDDDDGHVRIQPPPSRRGLRRGRIRSYLPMAADPTALGDDLARELRELVSSKRPLRYRLGDAFLPAGTAPPGDARLRCCTCGFGAQAGTTPTACPLCGSHAWELLPALAAR
jgi:hypothetical protein